MAFIILLHILSSIYTCSVKVATIYSFLQFSYPRYCMLQFVTRKRRYCLSLSLKQMILLSRYALLLLHHLSSLTFLLSSHFFSIPFLLPSPFFCHHLPHIFSFTILSSFFIHSLSLSLSPLLFRFIAICSHSL